MYATCLIIWRNINSYLRNNYLDSTSTNLHKNLLIVFLLFILSFFFFLVLLESQVTAGLRL